MCISFVSAYVRKIKVAGPVDRCMGDVAQGSFSSRPGWWSCSKQLVYLIGIEKQLKVDDFLDLYGENAQRSLVFPPGGATAQMLQHRSGKVVGHIHLYVCRRLCEVARLSILVRESKGFCVEAAGSEKSHLAMMMMMMMMKRKGSSEYANA